MATKLPGGGKALDQEIVKFALAGTATSGTVATKFKRVISYESCSFAGTVTSGFVGTVAAPHALTLQGTVADSTADGSYGYVAGTAEQNAITFQRSATATASITYVATLRGNA